jgi:phage shock protein A
MRTCCWLILVACLLAGFCARADTVKLKDGTELDGEIVAEDDSTLSILLQFAGGTITQTRHINKSDIAGVTRWTPEQKAQRQLERDYEDLQKYQLNPTTSYQITYYDQVINNGFRKFLTDHPNSPYTSNIIDRAAQWIAERDIVNAGKAKYQGRWVPAAEVDAIRGEQWLQQGRATLARGNPDLAIQQLRPILSLPGQTGLVSEARTLLTSAFQQSFIPLDHLQQQLPGEISSAQQRVDQAQQAANQAGASMNQSLNSGQSFGPVQDGSTYHAMGGNSQQVFQNQAALTRAEGDLSSAQSQLVELQRQLAVVKQRMTALQSQASSLGIQMNGGGAVPASAVATSPAPSTPITADAPPVLSGMITWIKDKWPVAVLAGLVVVYLLSRLTKA